MGLEGQSLEKLSENVEVIDTPMARFRFIYENHQFGHSPEELGHPDAFATEAVGAADFADPEVARRMVGWLLDNLSNRKPTERAPNPTAYVESLEVNRTPVYLVDIVDPEETYFSASVATYALGTGANVGASVLAATYIAKKIKDDEPMSRRKFLKGALATGIAAKGAVSATPQIADLTIDPERFSKPGPVEKTVRSTSEAISPEIHMFIWSFRNAVWAHKLNQIAQKLRDEKGQKPEIAMQLGRAHSGLETMLRADPEKRLSYIRNASRIINLLIPFKERGVRISSIARLEFKDSEWVPTETYHEPDLEQIER
ncbi:MAG: twin-arginine translocation signal domain-containing protein [Patescibacteria group bacterium]|nr:twin-arginine translocation signal domain-containing protein [Patescibacteria group bacterium]